MTTNNLEGQKKEIAQGYIEQLKTELGGLKGSVLSLFKNRIESLLVRSDDLPEDLFTMDDLPWYEKIGLKLTTRIGSFLSPESMDRVVNFIKEKHKELQLANTNQELHSLSRQIKNPGKPLPPEDGINSSIESPSSGTEGESSTSDSQQGKDQNESAGSGATPGSTDEGKEKESDQNKSDANIPLETDKSQTGGEKIPKDEKREEGSSDAIVKGIETGGGAVAVVEVGRRTGNIMAGNKEIKGLTNSAEEITKTKKSLQTMIHHLEGQLSADHLSLVQKSNIQATVERFEEGIAAIDDGSLDGLQARKKLGMGKLSPGILDGLVSHPQYKTINKLLGENTFLESIAKSDSDDAMKALFKTHGVENIDEFVGVLRSADDIPNIARIIRHAQGIKAFKAASYAGVYFEAASIGVDIRMYYDAMQEAKTVEQINAARAGIMREQANFNLRVGIATGVISLGVEIGLLLAASGPPGRIGLGIGVTIGGVSYCITESADSLYFEKKNFYYQNQAELKKQIMPQLWRSTISAIHGITTGDIADHKSGRNTFIDIFVGFSIGIVPCIIAKTCGAPSPSELVASKLNADVSHDQRYKLMCDTIASTLFLQTFDPSSHPMVAKYTYENTASKQAKDFFKDPQEFKQYEEEIKKINEVIGMKMDYMKDFLPSSPKDPKGQKFIDPSGSGVAYLMQLYHEADIYYDMHTQEASCYGEDVKTYEAELLGDCLTKEPSMIQKLEAIKGKDDYYYEQILSGLEDYVTIHKSSRVTDNLKNRGQVLETYIRLHKLGQSYSHAQKKNGSSETTNYKLLEDFFTAPDQTDIALSTALTERLVYDMIRDASIEKEHTGNDCLSGNIFKDFLRKLGEDVYKKDLSNKWSDIISFYNGTNKDHLAIAYDTNSRFSYNGGFIGQKGGRDLEIDPNDFETKTTEEITEEIISKIGIDTAAETADDRINAYVRSEMTRILRNLVEYKKPEKRKEVGNNVVAYIKSHGKVGSYIRLPNTMRDEMILSGLGNPSDYFFSYDIEGNIVALKGESDNIIPLKIPNILYKEIPRSKIDILSMKDEKFGYSYRDVSTSIYKSFVGLLNVGENIFHITTIHQQHIREMSEEYNTIWTSYQCANTETQKTYYIARIKEMGKRMLGHSIGLCVEGLNNSTGNSNVNSPDELRNILGYEQSIFDKEQGYTLNEKIKKYIPGYDAAIKSYKTSNGRSIEELCNSDDPMMQEYGRTCALWIVHRIALHTLGNKQRTSSGKSASTYFIYPTLKNYVDRFPLNQKSFTQEMPPIEMRYNAQDLTEYDANEKREREEDIQIKDIDQKTIEVTSSIDGMVKSIQATDAKTLNESRMIVIYERESGYLQGYGYKTNIEEIEKVLGTKLSLQEKVWGTHLINYFKWYKSKNPNATISYGSRLGTYPGIYNNSTRILSESKIESIYPFILDGKKNIRQVFIDHINNSI